KQLVEEQIAKHGQGRLFPGRDGGTVDTAYLSERLKGAAREAGVPEDRVKYIIPYSFRHRYAVDLLLAGVPERTVATLLGHADTKTLQKHYAHALAQVRNFSGCQDTLAAYRASVGR